MTNKNEIIFFGAGCFWGVQKSFHTLDGVKDSFCGFMGGNSIEPTYKEICLNNTGHVEIVKIIFDSSKISLETLLKKFFAIHDPTQLNRQGSDIGDQYRSVIFFTTPKQHKDALTIKTQVQAKLAKPIVTAITKACKFWLAEEYHQHYLQKNNAVCNLNVLK